MLDDPVRSRLMDLIAHRDPPTDLKRASLACGKNHAYLHQFVHRGTPRRLPEDARHALAAHLGVDQSVLRDAAPLPEPLDPHPNPPMTGGGVDAGTMAADLDDTVIRVPELRVSNLAENLDPAKPGDDAIHWCFPLGWVRHALRARPESLRIVGVDGDSMEPLFRSGDQLLVDTDRRAPSPPGVFILSDGVGLVPRSLEFLPMSDPPIVLIRSPGDMISDQEVPLSDVRIVGRAIWHARRL